MCGLGERLTKFQATTSGPECQKPLDEKAKQRRTIEKPKLDNAWKLRGNYFIDRDDRGSKKPLHTHVNVGICQWKAALPCKLKTYQSMETCGESDNWNSKHACIEKADESTRKRLERTLPKNHEDRIAGEELNSLSHDNLVQATENPGCKSSGG